MADIRDVVITKLKKWARGLAEKGLVDRAYVFGSLTYEGGLQFTPESSDVDLILRIPPSSSDPLQRLGGLDALVEATQELETALFQALPGRDGTKPITSITPVTEFELRFGVHKGGKPELYSTGVFLDLLKDSDSPGPLTRASQLKYEDHTAGAAGLEGAQKFRNQYVAVAPNASRSVSEWSGDKDGASQLALPKDVARAAAQLRYYRERLDDKSRYDVARGIDTLHDLVREREKDNEEYKNFLRWIAPRRGGPGTKSPLSTRHQILLWEVLAVAAEKALAEAEGGPASEPGDRIIQSTLASASSRSLAQLSQPPVQTKTTKNGPKANRTNEWTDVERLLTHKSPALREKARAIWQDLQSHGEPPPESTLEVAEKAIKSTLTPDKDAYAMCLLLEDNPRQRTQKHIVGLSKALTQQAFAPRDRTGLRIAYASIDVPEAFEIILSWLEQGNAGVSVRYGMSALYLAIDSKPIETEKHFERIEYICCLYPENGDASRIFERLTGRRLEEAIQTGAKADSTDVAGPPKSSLVADSIERRPLASRDNFSEKTKNQIAKRAGWLCSFPSCRAHTVGATADGKGEVNIGIAAHICAAAPGGPRWKEEMLPDERSSADNGIWLCQSHAKVIDSDPTQYPADLLHKWKKQAAADSLRRVLRGESASAPVASTDSDLTARLRAAATKDLEVFKRTEKWPRSSVPLTLEVEGFEAPVTTDALARVVTTLDDLILVAGPGMGKTTTLFQIAAGVLESASGVPLVVLLNDWATEGASVLESILKRPAYTGVSEAVFRKAAAQPGVVLLLDGWNEMDADARKRARVQVNALKAELPELGLVVSARKPRNQALDVPFSGKRVDLLPLSDEQQMRIARTMRGEEGVRLLDQAWRTAGVRELVTIPLYLTALLSLPKGAPFPTTKEEVLRHFVTAHEKEDSRAEALQAVVQDFQQEYLDGLAAFATSTAQAAIADTYARQSVSDTVTMLVSSGQITVRPEPNAVLDVLVGSHVLMRAGDTRSVSFQHQQFQEYYASHSVERRILADIDDTAKRETLKAKILNFPTWEEAILFAVERMSRGDAAQRAACGKAILAAFEVDPLLAADMIFRSTDDVWSFIASPIQASIKRWHTPGKVDRAFRFMLTSGRAEFLDAVWPLITDENEQVSLKALRNCKRFRPSVLGKGAAAKIKALPEKPRLVLLSEMGLLLDPWVSLGGRWSPRR